MLSRFVGKLELNWQSGSAEEMVANINQGMAMANAMLDSKSPVRGLSIRITARLYAVRAKLHLFQRNYILADADSSYALMLDPYQHEVCGLAHCLLCSILHCIKPIHVDTNMRLC